MREVLCRSSSIGDHIEITLIRLRDDQIVEDAALLVGVERQGGVIVRQIDQISDNQLLEESNSISTFDLHLQHVRDIEDRGIGTRVQVRLDDRGGVLDGQCPTTEANPEQEMTKDSGRSASRAEHSHASEFLHVKIVQSRFPTRWNVGRGRTSGGLLPAFQRG